MSFSQGLSGLNAAAKALDVVGNNIANSQTIGFKSGSISFSDIFAGSSGLGVQVAGISQDFSDGNLATANSPLSMGIQGKGFFRMVNEGGGVFYGRNGEFTTDEKGNVVNKTNGMFLTGFLATGTPPKIEPGAPVGPIKIPTADMAPEASTSGSISGNLKSDSEDVKVTTFKHDDPDSYNYASQLDAFDSLGNKHTIKVYFVKNGGEWTAYARDETSPGVDGSGVEKPYAKLDLKFDTNGNLDLGNMPGGTALNIEGAAYGGSAVLDLELDLKELTRNSSESLVKLTEINGQEPGKQQGIQIGENGEVLATYSNGKRQVVAQVILADFANSGGLSAEGNNVWSETPGSGQPYFGTSGTGSLGTLYGSQLESSNVELSQEMVNLIVHQRNYQSNSQTIKTQSELMQSLINLR